ncbi:uncharacterized protein [Palaemon carinicauda]|uniref:uncharacterized protein n=1 Tax=Palaemon carinicauda TaxID=392227 RepID=UPI0035B58E53
MTLQTPQRNSPSPVARSVLMMAIASAIIIGFSNKYGSENTESVNSRRANEEEAFVSQEPPIGRYRSHLPPVWGQFQSSELHSSPLATSPILMVVTTKDIQMLQRSIENILHATSGTGINLIISLQKPSSRTLRLLSQYPLKIHIAETNPEDDDEDEQIEEIIPVSSLLRHFRKAVGILARNPGFCEKDPIRSSFKVLNTARNNTHTSTYHLTLEEIRASKHGVPFEDNPFNIIHRKAAKNSIEINENGMPLPKERKDQSLCEKTKLLRGAVQFALETFPTLDHLILLESGYSFAANYIRYFEDTLALLKEDPSIYCISAHNPLANEHTLGDPSKVYRVDHFVSRGTLIPKRIVEEIANDFVVYEDTAKELQGSALDILETWLSWWSRRRRRGCVIPNIPRICPFERDEKAGDEREQCHPQTNGSRVNTTRLVHYQYSQDIYHQIKAAKTLGAKEKDCRKESFFLKNMNPSEIYSLSVKMENYDDDFTFHHVMKCFGLDLSSPVGYFEGIFQFSFHNASLMIMAVPYSRFSPAIKDPDALILADTGNEDHKTGRLQYLKHRNLNFTFSNLPVIRINA